MTLRVNAPYELYHSIQRCKVHVVFPLILGDTMTQKTIVIAFEENGEFSVSDNNEGGADVYQATNEQEVSALVSGLLLKNLLMG